MNEVRTGWIDERVGATSFEALRDALDRGATRLVLWGPRGVGRSTVLARLAAARPHVRTLDAQTMDDARAALAAEPVEAARVVGARMRLGLEADAYVECRALPLQGSEGSARALLERLLERDGTPPVDPDALDAIVRHTEGLPALVRRAAELLRLLSPRDLLARCDAATQALVVHGAHVAHPLSSDAQAPDEALPEGELLFAAALLVAAGEPLESSVAERFLPGGGLDALLGLRDRGVLVVRADGRIALSASTARELARRPAFRAAFERAAAVLDADTVERARAARQQWSARGDEAALDALGALDGRARRAAERALTEPIAVETLVECVLGLFARSKVQLGPRADGALLVRACDALAASPEGLALRVERLHWLRLTGQFDTLERAMAELDVTTLAPPLAARWHIERAQAFRYRREFAGAEEHLARAAAHTTDDAPLDAARDALELGALRYWQQRFDEALALYARARTLAARLGATRTEAVALSNACLCHTMMGDDAAASDVGVHAVELFRRIGDSGALGTTLGHLGALAYQYSRLVDAERFLAEADARVEQAGYFEQRVNVRFNRACVALAAGELELAEARLRSLPALLAASPSSYVLAHLGRIESDLHEQRGRLPEARAALERGLAEADASDSTEARAQLGAQLARVLARLGERDASRRAADRAEASLSTLSRPDLHAPCRVALEHAARLRGEPDAGTDRLAEALRPVWEGHAARVRIGVSALDSGAVRAAAALSWGDLSAAQRIEVEWRARDPGATALCLDERGERARLPGGALHDAATRRNAHRALVALATAGSEGCTRDALIEAVWPGEQMLEEAALNRLHNALAQLRAAGLAQHVVRTDTRYRLEGLRVVRAGLVDPFSAQPPARARSGS